MSQNPYDSLWSMVLEMANRQQGHLSPSDASKIRDAALACQPGDENHAAFIISVVQGIRDGVISGKEKDRFIVLSQEQAGRMKWTLEQWMKLAGFIVGIFFLLILLVVALLLPNPTQFQYVVLRTLLSLAGAAFTLALTGMLVVKINTNLPLKGKLAIYATATFGVFIVLYMINPAKMVLEKVR